MDLTWPIGLKRAKTAFCKMETYVGNSTYSITHENGTSNVDWGSGNDNLALHRYNGQAIEADKQRLDHIGFIIDSIDDVDKWYSFFVANNVKIVAEPRTHRDGARSFYCTDPSGTVVQIIYHPPISGC